MKEFSDNLFFYKKEYLSTEKDFEKIKLYIQQLQPFVKNLDSNQYSIIIDDSFEPSNDYFYKFDIKLGDIIIGKIMLSIKPPTFVLNIGMIIYSEYSEYRGKGICKNIFVDWVKNLLNDGFIVHFESILNIEAYKCYMKLAESYDYSETYENINKMVQPSQAVIAGGINSRRLTKKRRLIKIKKPTKRRRTTKRRLTKNRRPIKRRTHTKRRRPTKRRR